MKSTRSPGSANRSRCQRISGTSWAAGPDGGDGGFEVMIVTADGQQHTRFSGAVHGAH